MEEIMERVNSTTQNATTESGILGELFLAMINVLVLQMNNLNKTAEYYPTDLSSKIQEEQVQMKYDYIIVGGGTAGTILANKLTETLKWRVLLLEAGNYPSETSNIPYFHLHPPNELWYHSVEKQDGKCQGFASTKCDLISGKGLGGTTLIDAMKHSSYQENDWEYLNNSFSNEELRKYYEQFQANIPLTFQGQEDGQERAHHTQKKIVEDAVKESTINNNLEESPCYIKNGLRANFANIFLSPIKNRRSLYLSLNSEALSIFFNHEITNETVGFRAGGVLAKINGVKIELFVNKEVILCAGAINNAKILLASGIGPKEVYEKFNLTNNIDLKQVGKNLVTQISVPIFISIDETRIKNLHTQNNASYEEIKAFYEFLINKKGLLTTTGISNLENKILSEAAEQEIGISHYYFPSGDVTALKEICGKTLKLSKDIVKILSNVINKKNNNNNNNKSLIVFFLKLLNPKSRGEVTLSSKNLDDPPLISNQFFTDGEEEYDLKTLAKAYKYIYKLSKSVTFEELKADIVNLDLPACKNFKSCSDGFAKCYVKNMAFGVPYSVGTTRVALNNDELNNEQAVVDYDLLILNSVNIRVIDASVLHKVPLGSTSLNIGTIAYKIQDKMI